MYGFLVDGSLVKGITLIGCLGKQISAEKDKLKKER